MQWYNPYTPYYFSNLESLLFWLLHFSHGRVFLGGGGGCQNKKGILVLHKIFIVMPTFLFKRNIFKLPDCVKDIYYCIYFIREINH